MQIPTITISGDSNYSIKQMGAGTVRAMQRLEAEREATAERLKNMDFPDLSRQFIRQVARRDKKQPINMSQKEWHKIIGMKN